MSLEEGLDFVDGCFEWKTAEFYGEAGGFGERDFFIAEKICFVEVLGFGWLLVEGLA